MRMEKVNALIKKEIGNIILKEEIRDPRVKFITIQSVDVSKDLQHARVRFSILSDDPAEIQKAQDGLTSCAGYIRKLISQRTELRYTPEVQFFFDKGVQHLAKIDMVLQEIKDMEKQKGDVDEAN